MCFKTAAVCTESKSWSCATAVGLRVALASTETWASQPFVRGIISTGLQ